MAAQSHDLDSAWLAGLTVLYVEDDQLTREQLARFLRRRVGRVVEASNGVQGLERFGADRPALVITDIEMPQLDGLAMASAIRQLDPDVPIVVTTAFEEVNYLRRSIDAGVDRVVAKPIDVDKLESVLLACARRLRAEALLVLERQREVEALKAHEREALGMLAGGMAHDFNNLVQAILANLEVATELVTPGTELAEVIDAALSASVQSRDLGLQLVTLSERRVRLNELELGPIEPTLAKGLAVCRAELRLDLAPGLLPVWQHSALLGRAFEELGRNADEAMQGGGVLSVTGALRSLGEGEVPPLRPGQYLELRFTDTGPGISSERLPRIFDPYFSTKPRGCVRGMGLGLSLCRAIVRMHQGTISAESPAAAGAQFTVLLPTFRPETKA